MLDAEQIALVRESFEHVRSRMEPASLDFYAALFRRAPHLREMFRDDLAGQGMKFMTTLAVIVDNLDDPAALEARYADLGKGHAALRVEPAHFDVMREALMETLANETGGGFTPRTEAAWRAAYDEVSRWIMTTGGIR